MSEDEARTAFEAAVARDGPYHLDTAAHRAFADWLEENGHDDEAAILRRWTPARQEAEDWLRDFAARCGQTCVNYDEACAAYYANREDNTVPLVEEVWRPITYDMVLRAGSDLAAGGEAFTQQGSENARDLMGDDDNRELFWRHWGTLTETAVSDDVRRESPFSCSC